MLAIELFPYRSPVARPVASSQAQSDSPAFPRLSAYSDRNFQVLIDRRMPGHLVMKKEEEASFHLKLEEIGIVYYKQGNLSVWFYFVRPTWDVKVRGISGMPNKRNDSVGLSLYGSHVPFIFWLLT